MKKIGFFVFGAVLVSVALGAVTNNVCSPACKAGMHCEQGKCVADAHPVVKCTLDKDCLLTETCLVGQCVKKIPAVCNPHCKDG